MEEDLLTFKKFRDGEVAADIAQKLSASNIYCIIENDDKFFDPTFAHNPMQNEARIKIRSPDFIKAHKVLEDYYHSQLDNIDSDYYLFEFTDKELFEILQKPDEWGELDYQLAQKILREREYPIDLSDIQSLKEKRILELAKPEKSQTQLVIAGYISALFGGLFGIVLGWILSHTKRTLPDGTTVYAYVENDRKHGRIISALGVVVLIFFLTEFLTRQNI